MQWVRFVYPFFLSLSALFAIFARHEDKRIPLPISLFLDGCTGHQGKNVTDAAIALTHPSGRQGFNPPTIINGNRLLRPQEEWQQDTIETSKAHIKLMPMPWIEGGRAVSERGECVFRRAQRYALRPCGYSQKAVRLKAKDLAAIAKIVIYEKGMVIGIAPSLATKKDIG